MAEIRKHNPSVSNPIDAALLAALGEPVKPVTPGARPAAKPAGAVAPGEERGERPASLTVTGITMGEGSWLRVEGQPFKGTGTQPVQPRECEES